ncbi:MAG: sortase [Anaerolineae bacterium]
MGILKKGLGFAGCLLQITLIVCITGAIAAGVIGWRAGWDGLGLNRLMARRAPWGEVKAAPAQIAAAPTSTALPFPSRGATSLPTIAPLPTPTELVIPWPTKTTPSAGIDDAGAAPAPPESTNPPPAPTAAPPGPLPTPTATPPPTVSESAIDASPVYAGSPYPQRPATRVVIPALNLDSSVIMSPIENQTWKVDHLDQALGHLEGTASPGEANNVVLAGHVTLAPDGRPGPFKELSRLQPGEVVIVYDGDVPYYYIIDALDVVQPTDVQVTFPTSIPKLTLITCTNFDYAQGRYADRLVAVAHLMEGQN